MLISRYVILSSVNLLPKISLVCLTGYQTQANSRHSTGMIIFIAILSLFTLIVLYLILKKFHGTEKELSIAQYDQTYIKNKITRYFEKLSSELYEKELNTFRFIYGLDIHKKKDSQITPEYDLSIFNLTPEQEKEAVRHLHELVEEIIDRKIDKQLRPSELMIFISDYYQFKAKAKVLEKVINELQQKRDYQNLQKAKDRLRDIQKKIIELKKSFT